MIACLISTDQLLIVCATLVLIVFISAAVMYSAWNKG